MADTEAALREEVCEYSRLVYERGLVGAAGGNVSSRVPGTQQVLITPSGISLREVEPSQLVTLSLDGSVLSKLPGARPSKESSMHLAVYSVRPDVASVIHVHPPFATAFAVRGRAFPMETVSARLKLREVICVPVADPGSPELRGAVAAALKSAPPHLKLLLLERHGILVFSDSLSDSYDTAELAEDTAKVAFLAQLLR